MMHSIIATFVVGYVFIVLENVIKVNKAAIALFMSVACWTLYVLANPGQSAEEVFLPYVGETCETILFLMGAMAIVEVVDTNGGFKFVSRYLHTKNLRVLLWEIVGVTFILSAVLDNMTTTIVMVMILRKLIDDHEQRLMLAGMVVLAANSGGAFSPIGDVTTIMLWIKGCVSSTGIITSILVPSLVSVVIPAVIVSMRLKGMAVTPDANRGAEERIAQAQSDLFVFSRRIRICIFALGVGGLVLVPIFHSVTGLPPFVGILALLSVLWIFTEVALHRSHKITKKNTKANVSSILHKIDMTTILFFLGILLAVGALGQTGALRLFGDWLDNTFHGDVYVVNAIIGILSSVVDNVPLVASAMGMYNIEPATATGMLQNSVQDGDFWNLLAYCAGTGGSLLVIGSAAGVIVMGLERMTFMWYLRRVSWLALIGYIAGMVSYWLMHAIA